MELLVMIAFAAVALGLGWGLNGLLARSERNPTDYSTPGDPGLYW
jgi:hypothetical protein